VPGQLFEEFGCTYYGPVDGHDLPGLIETFNELKNFRGLCVLHLLTEKGKGYAYAVEDPESFHGVSPGAAKMKEDENGRILITPNNIAPQKTESYTSVFGRKMIDLAEKDERVVAITAAMPDGTGLKKFADRFPDRYFDTGITEQHAVAFAGGLAHTGVKPVVAIYSTFMQRCYDQVFQEICLQNSDVLLAMDRGGVVGQDGPTHHGLYDIAFLRTLPRIGLMSPKDKPEFEAMLDFAVRYKGPMAIRYPRAAALDRKLPLSPIEFGKGELLAKGEDVLIIAYGSMALDSLDAIKLLGKRRIHPSLINARFAKPLDKELIAEHVARKRFVVTVEEHALAGGFGSAVAEFLPEAGFKGRLLRLGIDDRFVEHGSRGELLDMLRLTPPAVADRVLDFVNEKNQARTYPRRRKKVKDQEVL
jgi:1-deoxy-D-xylulose-5-phosphate synthase